jgi:hypothetical protein
MGCSGRSQQAFETILRSFERNLDGIRCPAYGSDKMNDAGEIIEGSHSLSGNLLRVYDETDRMLGSARQWCGSKGAYNRPSYPCHYCTYRGGLLRQGAVDKAKADDQRHAGERQHHHLEVRKAVGGKQREIVHDMPPPPEMSPSLVAARRRKVQGGT